MSAPRTTPSEASTMPTGIPYIIGNEAAERFSFYGMKAALAIFIVQYLHLLTDVPTDPISEATSTAWVHNFVSWVYLTPLLGAFISDRYFGKYKTIISLSLVYCAGHFVLAFMGVAGPPKWFLLAGLGLITLGAGGIKPCVSAHVGDQFGPNNQHLLTKVFNWFYFSINLGAAVSSILIPWTLEWFGPHWAFGIPGILMALATLAFWMGRNKFVHIPPAGKTFTQEVFTKNGIATLLKLCGIFAFVSIFWSLFDQTATTWVFQSQDMDRNLFGTEILPSQIQAANPFLILILIPIFTFFIYPTIDKFWKLTPLRKMGIGLFLTAASFSISAIIQQWIGAGQSPTIAWQLFAYLLLTSGEIMVSIVCLEFAYKNSPASMKSMVMSLFLVSVAAGNFLTSAINSFIQVASPTSKEMSIYQEKRESGTDETFITYDGFDQKPGTLDDIIVNFKSSGAVKSRQVPAQATLEQAADIIQKSASENNNKFPLTEIGTQLINDIKDPWGNPLRYLVINSTQCRILSNGPDKTELTQWDTGLTLNTDPPAKAEEETSFYDNFHPEKTWLETRKAELKLTEVQQSEINPHAPFNREFITGGQSKLQGASYFWFFTGLMTLTALIFIPASKRFKEVA